MTNATYPRIFSHYSRPLFLPILMLLTLIGCQQNMMQRAVPLSEGKKYNSELAANLSPQEIETIAGSV